MNTSMLHEKSDAVHFLRGPEEMTTATSSVVDGGGQEADFHHHIDFLRHRER